MARFDEQHLSIMHLGATLFGTGEKLGLRYKKIMAPPGAWQWQEFKENPDGSLTETMRRSDAHLAALELEAKKPRASRAKGKPGA